MARSRADIQKPLQERDPNANAGTPNKDAGNDTTDKPKGSRKKSTTSKDTKSNDATATAASLATINLDGDETESVPIYSTCDDVRREINTYTTKTGVSKAALSRELSELLPSSKVSTRNLDQLLKMKGPRAGGHNIAFYAGYVFFEKIRIRDGKKKSVKRQKMEETWEKEGGFPREGSHNMRLFCVAGEKWKLDQYGQIQISGMPSATSGGISRKKPTAR